MIQQQSNVKHTNHIRFLFKLQYETGTYKH